MLQAMFCAILEASPEPFGEVTGMAYNPKISALKAESLPYGEGFMINLDQAAAPGFSLEFEEMLPHSRRPVHWIRRRVCSQS
jgi:hypothetical protein